MLDSCSSDSSGRAGDMNHVFKYKGIDVSPLLSEREKRQRKKTSSLFLANVDIGLSCLEFVSTHTCPKCCYYTDKEHDSAYIFKIAKFGRCVDPVEPHYVAELELKCKNCKAIRTILKHGPREGVRVTLPSIRGRR